MVLLVEHVLPQGQGICLIALGKSGIHPFVRVTGAGNTIGSITAISSLDVCRLHRFSPDT